MSKIYPWFIAFALLIPGTLAAQAAWRATEVQNNHATPITGRKVPGGLPDGLLVTGKGEIASAWYGGPTTRYAHAILGDAIEASILHVTMRDGRRHSLELPEDEVFEDRYPRLADLDGDGTTEIVTIRSSVSEGASVTVYKVAGNRLVESGSTGFIGLANRWLNIAGIADFRGNSKKQIAFVRTPHIGGTLFLFEFGKNGLTQVGAIDGFSNHVIGSREMRLSAAADINGDGKIELALPSDDRRTLRIVGFRKGVLAEIASLDLPAPIDKAITVKGSGTAAFYIVGLENAKSYKIHR